MYQVLLVDDEQDILNTLQNSIDWASYGVEAVLTARNGLDALKILEQSPVTLIISDIKMPGIDGIAFFREVRIKYPQIRCVILSSYREFSYAQEAIKLGVENYLLKPVNTEELDQTISKCLTNLSIQKTVLHSLFVDNILHRWVANEISSEDLAERSKHIQVNIYFRNYCVVVIETPRHNFIDELLPVFLQNAKYEAYHFIDYNNNHVLILGAHTIEQSIIQGALQSAIEQTNYPYDLKAAIGPVVVGNDQVSTSFRNATDAMLLFGSVAGQHIIQPKDSPVANISEYLLSQIVCYLKDSLETDTELSSYQLFEMVFQDIAGVSLSSLNTYINTLSIRLPQLLAKMGMLDLEAKNNPTVTAYHFEEQPDKETLYDCFCNILSQNLLAVKKHMKHLSPICLLAIQYISKNFTEYVSIKDFCSQHNANASYFGYLFKRETGIYFNDYLSQIRINHAMSLLKNTNLKISQISQMSGFSNTSYFIQCFRKRTGASPTIFKQMLSEASK